MRKKACIVAIIGLTVLFYMGQNVIDNDILKKRYSERYVFEEIGLMGYLGSDILELATDLIPQDKGKVIKNVNDFYEDKIIRPYDFPQKKAVENIILVQLEGVDSIAVDLKLNDNYIMKNLNKLKSEGIWFSNVYDQTGSGRTSDGEFLALTSLLPVEGESMYTFYDLNKTISLPKFMNLSGHKTIAFHGNDETYWNRKKAHQALGFESGMYINDCIKEVETNYDGWGLSDRTILKQTYQEIKTANEPIFTHTILLTGHHPYEAVNKMDLDLPYQKPESLIENYINCLYYTDLSLGEFFEALNKDGILQDSLIVVFSDHDSGITKDVYNFMGMNYDQTSIECDKIPLIIFDGVNRYEETEIMGQSDIMPLILSYLNIDLPDKIMGLNYIDNEKVVYLNRRIVNNCKEVEINEYDMNEITKALVRWGDELNNED